MSFEADGTVRESRDKDIYRITFNRPHRRNAVNVEACFALHEAVRRAAQSDARVVILDGAGQDFCVGADLRSDGPPGEPVSYEALMEIYHAATLLHDMRQVTIAAVDGGCAGAGMGWACACDFRFATPEAVFSTAFLNVGVSGDMGLAWSLTRIVGPARARDLMLFPRKLDGAEALELGLVTRLFPRDALFDGVEAAARALCERDTLALRLHKANLVSSERMDFHQYVELESARHIHSTQRAISSGRLGATSKPER